MRRLRRGPAAGPDRADRCRDGSQDHQGSAADEEARRDSPDPGDQGQSRLHQQDDDAGSQGLDALTLAEASPQGEASVLFADLPREEVMAERMVRLRLNQQQLELIDNSVKAGEAS